MSGGLCLDFVILAWNSGVYIEPCLKSVLGLGDLCRSVRVVDNGSVDGTPAVLARIAVEDERLRFITLPKNKGTTVSRNLALREIFLDADHAPYICILDSDTVVNAEAFESALNVLEDNSSIAVAGPTLVGSDGVEQLSGRNLPTLGIKLGKAWPLGSVATRAAEAEEPAAPVVDGVQDVGYLISACWITPTWAWERVGLLDEAIFYAPEDVDWCLRCHEAGYRVVRVRGSAITHYYQRLSKKKLVSKTNWEHARGLVHFFRKHGYLFRAPDYIGVT